MMEKVDTFLDWLYGPEAGGSTARPWHVLEYSQRLGDSEGAIFWRIVTEAWSGFDLIPHAEFEKQFLRFSATAPGSSGAYPITLFRGQDANALVGLSWTSCPSVAAGFARGHRGQWNKAPVVLETTAESSKIAFECDDRDEREYVLLARPNDYWLAGAG